MTLKDKYKGIKSQRALESLGNDIFQIQRRPGSIPSVADDPIIPGDCGDDRYDIYLSMRKGESCWIGDNVFTEAQGAFDAAATLLNAIGGDRPISIWVDPAPPWHTPEMDDSYGPINIASGITSGAISFVGPGGALVQGESWNAGTIEDISISNNNDSFVLEFQNIDLRDILFDDTGEMFIKMVHCNVGSFLHTAASMSSAGSVQLHLELFETFWGVIDITDDPSSASATYFGELVFTWMENCFAGPITVNGIGDSFFSSSWLGYIRVGFIERTAFHSIFGNGTFTENGFDAAIHITEGYNGVIIDQWNDLPSFSDNLVVLNINSPFDDDETYLTIHNCTLTGGASDYLLRNVGSAPAHNVTVANNFNQPFNGGASGGVIGLFENSVFGPNCPDCMDYSGVTGVGNKIWQDCGSEAAAAGGGEEPLMPESEVFVASRMTAQEPFIPPTQSGPESWDSD